MGSTGPGNGLGGYAVPMHGGYGEVADVQSRSTIAAHDQLFGSDRQKQYLDSIILKSITHPDATATKARHSPIRC